METRPIPEEHAIRGFYSATLSVDGYEYTSSVLTDVLGFNLIREEGSRCRFQFPKKQREVKESDGANIVDVLCLPYTSRGYVGVDTVHHIAWRTPTDEQQKRLRSKVVQAGLNATPVIDRAYFHSVYFREPGGVLFEIATNHPGFTIRETRGVRDSPDVTKVARTGSQGFGENATAITFARTEERN